MPTSPCPRGDSPAQPLCYTGLHGASPLSHEARADPHLGAANTEDSQPPAPDCRSEGKATSDNGAVYRARASTQHPAPSPPAPARTHRDQTHIPADTQSPSGRTTLPIVSRALTELPSLATDHPTIRGWPSYTPRFPVNTNSTSNSMHAGQPAAASTSIRERLTASEPSSQTQIGPASRHQFPH